MMKGWRLGQSDRGPPAATKSCRNHSLAYAAGGGGDPLRRQWMTVGFHCGLQPASTELLLNQMLVSTWYDRKGERVLAKKETCKLVAGSLVPSVPAYASPMLAWRPLWLH